MEPARFILLSFVLLPFFVAAQNACGVYASREDFVNNSMTYTFDDCSVKKRVNKDLVGRHHDMKIRFDFRFIYGYSDGKNVYRSYGLKTLWTDHGYYRVIYDKDVVLYDRTLTDYRNNSKTHYYFSLAKDSPIYPLRKRFYDGIAQGKGKVHMSALMDVIDKIKPAENRTAFSFALASVDQKKKPDISARLQTTTRRPKIFNVRSWWRKQEQI